MLKNLLEQKSCFKLICGAGNENLDEVEKLVAIYSAAGCRFFDFAANEEVFAAAQRGLDFVIPKEEQNDYHFCVSIGTKNDAHFQKAQIDSDKCIGCGNCVEVCPQKAILDAKMQGCKDVKNSLGLPSEHLEIVEKNCIGCTKCQKVCKSNAISFESSLLTSNSNFPFSILHFPLACIELHVSDAESGLARWEELKNFEGMLSICLGRKVFSDEKIEELLRKMIAQRPPYSVIIQADGNPMSGSEDDFETTLPAVETGMFIKSLNLPVYLILSGGTNSKTAQLCREKGLEVNGIAFGTCARKLVKKYIEREDFWINKAIFNKAVEIASDLVKSLAG